MTDLHSQRPCYKGRDHNSRQRAAIASGSVVTAVPPRLSPRRGPQLQCAFCNKPFPKTSKRPAWCCSPRCSKALLRETARLDGVQVPQVGLSGCTLKSQSNSSSCKAKAGHPYPCRFSIPVDILGRGHRWPGAPKLDRETRDKIAWREIGRAP